ncbi:MAG: nickel pincer cofactor biosynthesis protein LarC [Bacteroidota bacterium]
MKIYIEAFSGLSGDMFLSALAELADAHEMLLSLPEKLNLPGAEVKIHKLVRNGIVSQHVKVIDNENDNVHRHLSEINQIIDNGDISLNSKIIAKEIFAIIGEAESKMHNIPISKIHFHEISAIDSIIDIIGSAVLIDRLRIKKSYSSSICTGYGFVNTQHGVLPVPAPATAEILNGIPTYSGKEEGERVTPTGAAILKYLNPIFKLPKIIRKKTVYGAGEKRFKEPNVLRISSIETELNNHSSLTVIECNMDDVSSEFLGSDFQQTLLENGAKDFYFTQIQMKKGRPGILLSCITSNDNVLKLSNIILENTSTIGVRYYNVHRNTLDREILWVETPYGKIRIKVVITPSGIERRTYEYEDLIKISKEQNIPLLVLDSELESYKNMASYNDKV